MFHYAQLDENNICFTVSELGAEVIAPNMIPIDSFQTDLLHKKYVNGTWVEVPKEESSMIKE